MTDLRYSYSSSHGPQSRDLTPEHVNPRATILRIGPNALAFNHPDAIKDIHGHKTECPKDGKGIILTGTHRRLLDVVAKLDHGRKRKLLSAAFAIKNLENREYKFNYTAQRLVKAFDERCTEPLKQGEHPLLHELTVDFNHCFNLWTIEAINFIALSPKMDLLDTGTDEVTAERLDGTTCRAKYCFAKNNNAIVKSVFCWDYDLWSWTTRLTSVVRGKRKQYWKKSSRGGDVTYDQTSERLRRYKAGENLDDFFTCFMEDKSGALSFLDWGEIVAEAVTFLYTPSGKEERDLLASAAAEVSQRATQEKGRLASGHAILLHAI